MSDSNIPATAAGEFGNPQSRLRSILNAPGDEDTLKRLVSAQLVTLHTGLPLDAVDVVQLESPAYDFTLIDDVETRVDPRKSRSVLADGRILGMYVQDCIINTEAEPPYHRLPSFPSLNPYHIVYLINFPPNQSHTVTVRMQVFSAGTVRITGTGIPAALTVGQSSFTLDVPVGVTTTAEGFASIFIQRVGETGFDWFSARVL